MVKQGDGLTGYTLANGYRLGAWERQEIGDTTRRARYWKKRGAPAKLAAVAGASSWSIHRSAVTIAYDNSGGCGSVKEGKEMVDILLRNLTERMDRDAEREVGQ